MCEKKILFYLFFSQAHNQLLDFVMVMLQWKRMPNSVLLFLFELLWHHPVYVHYSRKVCWDFCCLISTVVFYLFLCVKDCIVEFGSKINWWCAWASTQWRIGSCFFFIINKHLTCQSSVKTTPCDEQWVGWSSRDWCTGRGRSQFDTSNRDVVTHPSTTSSNSSRSVVNTTCVEIGCGTSFGQETNVCQQTQRSNGEKIKRKTAI